MLERERASPLRTCALDFRKALALGGMHVGTSTRWREDDPKPPKVALRARHSAPSSPLALVNLVMLVEISTAAAAVAAEAAAAVPVRVGGRRRRTERGRTSVTRSLLPRLPLSLLS